MMLLVEKRGYLAPLPLPNLPASIESGSRWSRNDADSGSPTMNLLTRGLQEGRLLDPRVVEPMDELAAACGRFKLLRLVDSVDFACAHKG